MTFNILRGVAPSPLSAHVPMSPRSVLHNGYDFSLSLHKWDSSFRCPLNSFIFLIYQGSIILTLSVNSFMIFPTFVNYKFLALFSQLFLELGIRCLDVQRPLSSTLSSLDHNSHQPWRFAEHLSKNPHRATASKRVEFKQNIISLSAIYGETPKW